jgi:hypothetical protein
MMNIKSDDTKGLLKTIPQERDYPDPRTLPVQPSWQQPRPQLNLSELTPGKYVSATARIVFLKTMERQDALGNKLVFSGILEDSTFKVPFVSHRISYPLIRNSVYKFYSAYVHEFEDKSLLLVVTRHTKIEPKNIEDYREFVWTPKIESIKRPVSQINLQGVITTIHSNSGLVKRCNKCKSILYDSCPNKCANEEGWGWDLRVSSRLYDGSGSIKMVLTKDIASRILQKNLSELILIATQANPAISSNGNQFQTSICTLKIPDSIEVIEAVTEDLSSSHRKNGKLIVTDRRNLVFLPTNEEHSFADFTTRQLQPSNIEDKKIIRRLIEKALEISIKKITGKKLLHGIFLLEDPIPLYRCEKARLYLGFSARVNLNESGEALIEFTPQAYVRESVFDYVNLRRERGASSTAIVRNLMTYRNRVIVAPFGSYGSITEVIMRKASSQMVSETDTRNLVEFWKQIYDIDISPEEIPLLKIKMVNSENTFTYPPSMCFFVGGDSLVIPAGVQKFIEYKKSSLKSRVAEVVNHTIPDLKIGTTSLGSEAAITEQQKDIQTQLLQEIRQRLFGRNVSARGSILSVHDELWFFPSQLRLL